MPGRRSRWVSVFVVLGVIALSPVDAEALETRTTGDGLAVVTVPAVPGATRLWVDVEAPGLDAGTVVLQADGQPVALNDTAFGAGAVLENDGAARSLEIGLRRAANPDIAITLVDSDGRVLFSDVARVPLGVASELTPTPSATPSGDASTKPTAGQSAAPVVSAPTATSPAGHRPRPGLPRTGQSEDTLPATDSQGRH